MKALVPRYRRIGSVTLAVRWAGRGATAQNRCTDASLIRCTKADIRRTKGKNTVKSARIRRDVMGKISHPARHSGDLRNAWCGGAGIWPFWRYCRLIDGAGQFRLQSDAILRRGRCVQRKFPSRQTQQWALLRANSTGHGRLSTRTYDGNGKKKPGGLARLAFPICWSTRRRAFARRHGDQHPAAHIGECGIDALRRFGFDNPDMSIIEDLKWRINSRSGDFRTGGIHARAASGIRPEPISSAAVIVWRGKGGFENISQGSAKRSSSTEIPYPGETRRRMVEDTIADPGSRKKKKDRRDADMRGRCSIARLIGAWSSNCGAMRFPKSCSTHQLYRYTPAAIGTFGAINRCTRPGGGGPWS